MQLVHNQFTLKVSADQRFHEDLFAAREKAQRMLKSLDESGFDDVTVQILDKDGVSVPLENEVYTVRSDVQEVQELLRKASVLLEKDGFDPAGVQDAMMFTKTGPHSEKAVVDWKAVKALMIDSDQMDADRFKQFVSDLMTAETLRGVSLKKGK